MEFFVVIYEYGRSGEPLSVEFAPYCFAPSGVGYCEVDAVHGEVVPIDAGRQMAECVAVVVGNHFGLSAGAAGEVDQHRVGDFVVFRRREFGGVQPFRMEVVEAFGDFRPDADECFDCRAFGYGCRYVFDYIFVSDANYGFDFCAVVPIYYVVCREKMSRGDGYGADFMERQHGEPKLKASFQYDKDHVAFADAEAMEVGGSFVRLLFYVRKCESLGFAFVVGPQQGLFVRMGFCPFIHYVVCEVEVIFRMKMEIFSEVLLR